MKTTLVQVFYYDYAWLTIRYKMKGITILEFFLYSL
jgi:hypothetical protein